MGAGRWGGIQGAGRARSSREERGCQGRPAEGAGSGGTSNAQPVTAKHTHQTRHEQERVGLSGKTTPDAPRCRQRLTHSETGDEPRAPAPCGPCPALPGRPHHNQRG